MGVVARLRCVLIERRGGVTSVDDDGACWWGCGEEGR